MDGLTSGGNGRPQTEQRFEIAIGNQMRRELLFCHG